MSGWRKIFWYYFATCGVAANIVFWYHFFVALFELS